MASGWRPADSQLALSTKFVPLMYSILESDGVATQPPGQNYVGDPVELAAGLSGLDGEAPIRKPDETVVNMQSGERYFTQTDMPGLYRIEGAGSTGEFAVNLPVRETLTQAIPLEELETLGVRMHQSAGAPVEIDQPVRQRRGSVELEREQKMWRWILTSVLALLIMEIWLAGRLTFPTGRLQGEQS